MNEGRNCSWLMLKERDGVRRLHLLGVMPDVADALVIWGAFQESQAIRRIRKY